MSSINLIFSRTAGVALAAWLTFACGSGSEQDASTVRAAISGGELDSADSNVFLLVSHRTQGVALCSASLIAPNLLLTARHCVSDVTSEKVACGETTAGAPLAARTFFATNAPSIGRATSSFAVSDISVPSEGADICGFDIALVTLKSSVPASVAAPLIPRVELPAATGEVYTAVGYGQDSPGDAGVAGDRRGRTGLRVSCAPGTCGGPVEADEFVGEAGICSGDSGGPALDSDGKVVGVVSRSTDNCKRPVYGSVADWKDWMREVASRAAAQGQYEPAAWVGEASEGSSAGAGGADAGGLSVLPGTQGTACLVEEDCAVGYGCYGPTPSPADRYCAALCSEQAECESGTRCDTRVGACVAPVAAAAADSTCSLHPGRRPAGSFTALAIAGLALTRLRRQRRRVASRR